jgi:2,3-dihydroxybenzoate decarboxylase
MKNPTRFAAFAAVSMHDPAQAAQELKRCMTEKKGFVGVLLNDFQSSGPDGNKMLFFDQPEYDPFWRACNDLEAPVYLHPRLPTPLIQEQMWRGREWLNFSALGYADRLNMHILGIITNGVLDRFPKVKLMFGHMGEHM